MANIKHGLDATADDSDKTVVVPAGEMWVLDWLHATLASSATVGNRQVNLELYDSSDVKRGDWHAGATQAASLTRHFAFQPGIYRETSFVDGDIQISLPYKLVVPSGWYVRVRDTAAVDAAADDLTLSYQFTKLAGN